MTETTTETTTEHRPADAAQADPPNFGRELLGIIAAIAVAVVVVMTICLLYVIKEIGWFPGPNSQL